MNWILRLATLPAAEYVMPLLFPGFARRWGDAVASLADRFGLRSVPAMEIWHSYRSLTDSEGRKAFVRTMRSVIDPGGQSISAIDRLYLTERVPTLIVWGQKRPKFIPLSHAYQALKAAPHSHWRSCPVSATFLSRRIPPASSRFSRTSYARHPRASSPPTNIETACGATASWSTFIMGSGMHCKKYVRAIVVSPQIPIFGATQGLATTWEHRAVQPRVLPRQS